MVLSRYQGNKGLSEKKDTVQGIKFTIQLSATKKPADKKKFKEIKNLKINLEKDGYYHYSTGLFQDKSVAEKELERIKGLGFPDAFIRKVE